MWYVSEELLEIQIISFVDLAHWYDKIHNSKEILGSVVNMFALIEEGSRSVDKLLTIFEAIVKNLDKTWPSPCRRNRFGLDD